MQLPLLAASECSYVTIHVAKRRSKKRVNEGTPIEDINGFTRLY